MIVVDASAILEVLLRTPAASGVERRLFEPGESLHAPHLIDVEAAQVVRRYAAAGDIDEQRGGEALADLVALPIRRWPHDILLPRVWELRGNFTAYDAVYVALAEALDAPLLTRDRRLAAAAARTGARRTDVIAPTQAPARLIFSSPRWGGKWREAPKGGRKRWRGDPPSRPLAILPP